MDCAATKLSKLTIEFSNTTQTFPGPTLHPLTKLRSRFTSATMSSVENKDKVEETKPAESTEVRRAFCQKSAFATTPFFLDGMVTAEAELMRRATPYCNIYDDSKKNFTLTVLGIVGSRGRRLLYRGETRYFVRRFLHVRWRR